MSKAEDKSFGIIPIFKSPSGEFRFCLVRHAAGHWGFPKGHQDSGESEKQTAIRELREEAGIVAKEILNDQIFREEYSYEKDGIQYHKIVTYFLSFTDAIDKNTEANFKNEIPELKWLPYPKAKQLLTFPEAKRVMDQVFKYLSARS